MKFIAIQAGHYPRTSGSTGAPGEQEFNWKTTLKLSEVLQSKGLMVQIVGADPKPEEINKDFDLFLSIHADANIYGTGGGFVDHPDQSIDYAHQESKRIKEAIDSEYFKHSEIVNHPERSNANTRFYYMWRQLTAKTPCVIIECGVVQDAHDKVLLADTDRITNALARGICKAFGVSFDPIQPEPQPQPEPPVEPPAPPPDPIEPPVVIPPAEPPICDCFEYTNKLKDIYNTLYGKGFWFMKYRRIKDLLPK